MNFSFILRQYRPALIGAFFVCAAAYLLYVFLGPREYRAIATVQGYIPNAATGIAKTGLAPGNDDFGSRLRLMNSPTLVESVATRMQDAERQNFLAAFTSYWPWARKRTAGEVLAERREVTPRPASQMIEVGFTHPNAAMAALAANFFAEEFVKLSNAASAERTKQSIAELTRQTEDLHKNAQDIAGRMNQFIDQYGLSSLDSTSAGVYFTAVQELNKIAVQNKRSLDDLASDLQQLQTQQQAGKPLWELSFIASQPRVAALLKQFQDCAQQLTALLNAGYPDTTPNVVVLRGRANAAGADLGSATETAARMVVSDYQTAQANYDASVKHLEEKQKEAQDLSKARTAFDALRSDREVAEGLYKTQMMASQQQETAFKLNTPVYSILQVAEAPAGPVRPSLRYLILNSLGYGCGGGLLTAIGLIIFRSPPKEDREEYERRRRRHRHFHRREHRR